MGSPSAGLNIPEFMRPWYQSGLQLLFRDNLPEQVFSAPASTSAPASKPNARAEKSVPPVPSAHDNSQAGQAKAQGAGSTRPNNSQVDHHINKTESLGGGDSSSFKGHHDQLNSGKYSPHGGQAGTENRNLNGGMRKPVSRKPLSDNKPQAGAACSNLIDWPEPFSKLAPRVASNVQILWTYFDLAHDLSGQADPERRKLFQSLIVHMGLPKGSISFWPCSRIVNNENKPEPELFWKGVHHFGVKFVACFGEKTQDIILPQADKNVSTLFYEEVQIVTLSDPDFMKKLGGDEHLLLATPLLRLPLF
ncbi:hypothetical protein [Maridesulfovibrio bastinii]|uniref:hypothetical protein n=1 Tax=Maridesulfovibrio bastinii TaxID=47157 RepID=UPI0004182281|nr:hypothetical protein [Maridesulfovibrio bastinii]